jgi:hypothetical protein
MTRVKELFGGADEGTSSAQGGEVNDIRFRFAGGEIGEREGTIHLAVGKAFPELGGTNESVVDWDIVKDLRQGAARGGRAGRAGARRMLNLMT